MSSISPVGGIRRKFKTSKRVFSLVVEDILNKTLKSTESDTIIINHKPDELQKNHIYEEIVDETINNESHEYNQTINKINLESKNLSEVRNEIISEEKKAASLLPGEESNLQNLKSEKINQKIYQNTKSAKPYYTHQKRALLTGVYAGITFSVIIILLLIST